MINFENARVLGYDHSHQYFSENLNFGVQKHLTVEGSIYNLTNYSGVSGVWVGLSGFVRDAIDYDAIIINGTNFGQGRINSIDFKEGIDVRKKDYNVDLTILASGNLYNMTGVDFSGLSLPNIHLTENFSENFDFSIAEDGTYSYKQTLNVKYIKGDAVPDPILAAKQLASGLLNSSPPYGFIDSGHSGFYNQPGRRTYTEAYNKITHECSFSENFTQAEARGNYAIKYTQEVNTAEDGISTVSEKGSVEGLLQNDYMGSAQSGLNVELALTYPRAATLLLTYFPSGRVLNTTYLSLQKRINQFTNSIDYAVSYNNDPRNQATYSWDYTQEITRGDSCYYAVKEGGRIKGITSDCTRAAQFNNAFAAWQTIKSGVPARLTSYYNIATSLINTLKPVTSNERSSLHAGEISYDYTYTDDLTFNNNQPIKRLEVQISDDLPVPAVNRWSVAKVGEIVQDLGMAKEAKRGVNLKMIGKRGTPLSTYLATGKAKLNQLIPTGKDVFINSCNYSFIPPQNNFDLQLEWIFFAGVSGFLV